MSDPDPAAVAAAERDHAVPHGGQVISRPQREHACAPGWRPYYVAEGDPLGFGPGWYSNPPWASDYPKGTVWQCECGQAWVSVRSTRGMAAFRREHWWERRRRERAS